MIFLLKQRSCWKGGGSAVSRENVEWVGSRGVCAHLPGLACSSDFAEGGVWQGGAHPAASSFVLLPQPS